MLQGIRSRFLFAAVVVLSVLCDSFTCYVIPLTDLHTFVGAKSRLPLDKGRRFWYYNTDRNGLERKEYPMTAA